jgi:hypothetical protein
MAFGLLTQRDRRAKVAKDVKDAAHAGKLSDEVAVRPNGFICV